jgi:hypothetical protein
MSVPTGHPGSKASGPVIHITIQETSGLVLVVPWRDSHPQRHLIFWLLMLLPLQKEKILERGCISTSMFS